MQHSTHFYPQRLKRFLAQPGSKISGAAGTCWNWLHVKVPITPSSSGSPRFLGINAVRWCIYISQCEPTTVQYSHLFAMSLYSQVHWYSWTALLLSGVDAMTAGAAHDSQHNQSAIRRENRGTTPSASHKSSQVPSSVQKYATVETTSKTPPELWDYRWESFINNRRKPSNCDSCSWKNPPSKEKRPEAVNSLDHAKYLATNMNHSSAVGGQTILPAESQAGFFLINRLRDFGLPATAPQATPWKLWRQSCGDLARQFHVTSGSCVATVRHIRTSLCSSWNSTPCTSQSRWLPPCTWIDRTHSLCFGMFWPTAIGCITKILSALVPVQYATGRVII